MFLVNNTAFSWKSNKQTLVVESSSEAESVALYEATREALFLKSLSSIISQHLQQPELIQGPIMLYEDNTQTLRHAKEGFIRTDKNKHVNRKITTIHSHVAAKQINVDLVASSDNVADILTKSLQYSQHLKLVHKLGLRSLSSLSS